MTTHAPEGQAPSMNNPQYGGTPTRNWVLPLIGILVDSFLGFLVIPEIVFLILGIRRHRRREGSYGWNMALAIISGLTLAGYLMLYAVLVVGGLALHSASSPSTTPPVSSIQPSPSTAPSVSAAQIQSLLPTTGGDSDYDLMVYLSKVRWEAACKGGPTGAALLDYFWASHTAAPPRTDLPSAISPSGFAPAKLHSSYGQDLSEISAKAVCTIAPNPADAELYFSKDVSPTQRIISVQYHKVGKSYYDAFTAVIIKLHGRWLVQQMQ